MTRAVRVSQSARLSYRLLGADDAELLFELDQDPEVMRFISDGVVTPKDKIRNVFLPRLASYTAPEKGWGMWGTFCNATDEFLGWIIARPMHFFSDQPHFDDIELGWRFKQKSWGKGIATEAAQHVMNTISETTGIKTFSAIAVTENYASIKIMTKLGMAFVSSGIHKDPLGDMLIDTYSLTLT